MKNQIERAKHTRMNESTDVRITDVTNHEINTLKQNEREMARKSTLEERIRFITTINAMTGHRQRKDHPITGDRFLL